LLLVEEEARVVEVLGPVISESVEDKGASVFLGDQRGQLQPGGPEERHLVEGLDEHFSGFIFAVLLLQEDGEEVEVDGIELVLVPQLPQVLLDAHKLLLVP
jgi:hypothetical protein